jgi:hypothetical protein
VPKREEKRRERERDVVVGNRLRLEAQVKVCSTAAASKLQLRAMPLGIYDFKVLF